MTDNKQNITIELFYDDCFNKMQELIDSNVKVDAIIIDPPYGITPLKWDEAISFDKIWEYVEKIKRNETTPVLIFGQEPFSTMVRSSNLKGYKYDWYWKKERLTNVFQVKRRPGKVIENIMVFYDKQCTYNPQKTTYSGRPRTNKIKDGGFSITQSGMSATKPVEYSDDGTRYPTQLIEINRDSMYDEKYHPTQKPVELMEMLVRTYTNEGDTVLDFVMGSGTTAVACKNTNRNFIGIENNEEYFNIAKRRVETV